jgi:hypothetical protein
MHSAVYPHVLALRAEATPVTKMGYDHHGLLESACRARQFALRRRVVGCVVPQRLVRQFAYFYADFRSY